MARAVVPHLAYWFVGVVFDFAVLSDWGHRLRVPTVCNGSMVVASVSLQGGTVSRFLCLLTCRLMVVFECLDLLLPRILCQGSSSVLAGLLDRQDPIMRSEWFFPSPVEATLLHAWAFPSFDLLPLFCSLVLNRRVVFLNAFIEPPWGYMLSVLPFVGWRLDRVGETFLSGALVPLLCLRLVWFASRPSPSRGVPGCLPSRQGMSVSSFGLSVGPYLCLVQKVLVRLLYRGSFYVT